MMLADPGMTGRKIGGSDEGEAWIAAPNLCKRLGIHPMSLWRWLRDPRLNFPQPIMVRKRRYFKMREVICGNRST